MSDDHSPSRIKHLELIQATVTRLASHSFAIKGVAITVSSGVAAFVVGKGPKLGVLPDFIIGATAQINQSSLITINPKDFATYFPKLKLIQPARS